MAKVQEGSSFGKHVGYANIKVLAVNPTPKQRKEVLGFNVDEAKEVKPYNGTSKDGVRFTRIEFWYNIKELNNPKLKESFSITLWDTQATMGASRLGWVDENGVIIYGETAQVGIDEAIERGYDSKFDIKSSRMLYRGEDTLMKVYKASHGKGASIAFDTNDINILFTGGDEANAMLNTFFAGKAKSFGGLLCMDNAGYVKVYENAFGSLDYIKKQLSKNAWTPGYYPESFELEVKTKDDLVDDPEEYTYEGAEEFTPNETPVEF